MKRLLLLEPRRLGDAIMSLPFLRGAEDAGWEVHVACSPTSRPLFDLVLPRSRLVEVRSRSLATLRALRRVRAEVGVSSWADVRDALLLAAAGVPRRVGFPMDGRNYYAHHLPWRRRSLRVGRAIEAACCGVGFRPWTDPVERKSYNQHHVDDWGQLADRIGFAQRTQAPWIRFVERSRLPAEVERFLDEARAAGKKTWLLHPGAAKPSRRWPHYARLAREVFAARGVPLIVVDPPGEPPFDLGSGGASEHLLVWRPPSLAAFLEAAGRVDAVLCNDSAAAHAGAAFGKRVAAVFGPGSADWFAPYAPGAVLFESEVCPFRPCYDRCVQPSYLCLEDVSYERVAAGVVSMIDADGS